MIARVKQMTGMAVLLRRWFPGVLSLFSVRKGIGKRGNGKGEGILWEIGKVGNGKRGNGKRLEKQSPGIISKYFEMK